MVTQSFQLNPNLRSTDARNFEEGLRRRIIGQDEAVQAVVDMYQSKLAGAPIGEFAVSGTDGGRENTNGRSNRRSLVWRSAGGD
jgi:hypothetical protein